VLVLLVLLPVLLLLLLLQLLELLLGACVVTFLPTNVASRSVAHVMIDVAAINVVAANVAGAVGVIVTKGNLCYYTSTNQQNRDRGMMYLGEVISLSLTLSRA
jgi:hypothetical protein